MAQIVSLETGRDPKLEVSSHANFYRIGWEIAKRLDEPALQREIDQYRGLADRPAADNTDPACIYAALVALIDYRDNRPSRLLSKHSIQVVNG